MKKLPVWTLIIFAISLYIIMGIYADFEKLFSVMKEFRWEFLFILFFLTTLNYLLRFVKWNFFLKKAGIYLDIKDNLFVFFSGLSMIITPGKIGEIWKGWLIKDISGEKLSKTIPVIIVERITDVLGFVIISVIGIVCFQQIGYFVLVLLLILSMFWIIIRSKSVWYWIISKIENRMEKHAENLKTMHNTFEIITRPKYLILMSLLSATGWFFECVGMYLVVLGFKEYINIVLSALVFSIASLAGAISMVPGGLGIAEGTLFGLLQFFGISSAKSVGISLVVRFGTLWYGAVMGMCIYLLFKGKIRKKY